MRFGKTSSALLISSHGWVRVSRERPPCILVLGDCVKECTNCLETLFPELGVEFQKALIYQRRDTEEIRAFFA